MIFFCISLNYCEQLYYGQPLQQKERITLKRLGGGGFESKCYFLGNFVLVIKLPPGHG